MKENIGQGTIALRLYKLESYNHARRALCQARASRCDRVKAPARLQERHVWKSDVHVKSLNPARYHRHSGCQWAGKSKKEKLQ